MNEDERGITPADVTAITVAPWGAGHWLVTIEQGNGDVIKTVELTEMERIQLGLMLGEKMGEVAVEHCSFLDPIRAGHAAAAAT